MGKTRFELNEQVRLNVKRDEDAIPSSIIDTYLERAHQRIADLETFEEMENKIFDPVIEDCEAAWDAAASVTCTADSTYYKKGTYSALATIAVGHTTGLAMTNVITSTDFTEYTHVKFWIRASVANAAGGLQIMLDDTATCASPLETIDIPVLVADTWKEVTLKLTSPTLASAIISIGLNVVTDVGAQSVYIDDVRKVRCTTLDIKEYSPPTNTKDILSIKVQDDLNSRKLVYVPHKWWDEVLPRVENITTNVPLIYTTFKNKIEIAPVADGTYPMFIRYSKYPTAFVETSLVIEDCEDAWVAEANVTSTADASYYKLGSYSSKNVIAAGHTTGLISTEDFAAVDLSAYTHIKFWVRSTVAIADGDVQVVLDDTAACASPLERLDILAIPKDKWVEQTIPIITPANLTAIISVGLDAQVDGGAMTIYLDDIRMVTTSESELLRKDQIIEAGATVYGFEYLRQKDDTALWEATFQGMMSEAKETNRSYEDWNPTMQPFSMSSINNLIGTSSNPFYGRR